MSAILWLIISIALGIIEFLTVQLVTIWFSIGGFAAAIVAGLGGGIILQFIVFAGVSLVLLIFTRPAVKNLQTHEKTNANSLIGKTGVITEPINSLKYTGRVLVEQQDWSAKEVDGKQLDKNTRVIVLRIEGAKLIVRECTKEDMQTDDTIHINPNIDIPEDF